MKAMQMIKRVTTKANFSKFSAKWADFSLFCININGTNIKPIIAIGHAKALWKIAANPATINIPKATNEVNTLIPFSSFILKPSF